MDVSFSELCGFTDWQWQATEAADRFMFTLAGGTRGPGKSYWLRWWLLRQALMLTGQGVESPTGQVKSTQDAGLGFHLNGGGMIALRNLDDPSKYVGAEFAAVGVDEITRTTRDVFDILRGSMRWPGVERVPFVATGNPGGIGHLWVKELWIDGDLPPELAELAPEFRYVRGRPSDNPHLPVSYWQMLETLPPELKRAWFDGDWDVFEGQVFSEWRRDAHVVEPFEIPAGWLRWRAVDWGYAAPFCCLWFAEEPDTHRVYVYREAYKAGLTDPEQALLIRRLSGEDVEDELAALVDEAEDTGPPRVGRYNTEMEETPAAETAAGERIYRSYADPSMWTRRTFEQQTYTTAQVYRKHGVRLTKADNERIVGVRRVHDALAMMDDGRPGLQIFSTCRNLVRTLPALPYDDVRIEDVDTDAEDHAYDALRYGLTPRRPRAARRPERYGESLYGRH